MSEEYQCVAIKSDKKPCTRPGVELFKKQYYCKLHYKLVYNSVYPDPKYDTENGEYIDIEDSDIEENDNDSDIDININTNSSDEEVERKSSNVDNINSDLDSDVEDVKPAKKQTKPKAQTNVNTHICQGFKKDGDECEKKGTEEHKNKKYCKVHYKQVIKNENTKMCEGFQKDGNNCKKKATDEYKEKYYCKVHHKQVITSENIKKCEGIKKDGDECDKKGTEEHKGKYYCKAHLRITVTNESVKICEASKKNGDNCEKKANNIHNNKHYCTIHYKQLTADAKKESKPDKKESKSDKKDSKEKEFVDKELAKKIYKEVQDFVKISTVKYHTEEEYTNIKRTFKNIALKIHPDKCKNINLDATELFKKVSNHMDKILKYETKD